MKLSYIYQLVQTLRPAAFPVTLKTFLTPLRKAFRPYPWIRFEGNHRTLDDLDARFPSTTNSVLCVSGRFEPDYAERGVCVITVTSYTTTLQHLVSIYGAPLEQLRFDIFTTIAHERIHLLQSYKARGCPRLYRVREVPHPSLKWDYEYYGANDELEAYGQTAALEEAYGFRQEVSARYRSLFPPTDARYKRFLKKRWKYSLTVPSLR